jgi:hypothetical protein
VGGSSLSASEPIDCYLDSYSAERTGIREAIREVRLRTPADHERNNEEGKPKSRLGFYMGGKTKKKNRLWENWAIKGFWENSEGCTH